MDQGVNVSKAFLSLSMTWTTRRKQVGPAAGAGFGVGEASQKSVGERVSRGQPQDLFLGSPASLNKEDWEAQ